MLVKTSTGWQVRSEKGRPLSKPDLTRKEAEERLAEVERFKNIEKWAKSRGAK